MSMVKVNTVTNLDGDGPPDFDAGVNLELDSSLTDVTINSSGTVYATSFSGDGSELTNVSGTSAGKAFAVGLAL